MHPRRLLHAALAFAALAVAGSAAAQCNLSNPSPVGAIADHYRNDLGGYAGPLGPALSCEDPAPHGGRYTRFKRGVIYWHPETGAHALYAGASLDLWNRIGAAEFGYPIVDERPTADGVGRYTGFRAVHLPGKPEAAIYFSPRTGAHPVYGAFWQTFRGLNYELSALGYPAGDERDDAGFRRQDFEGGYLRWSAASGVAVVQYVGGAIGERYRALGGFAGPLGPPLGGEQPAPYGGRFNPFRAGWIYWHPETGAHAVYGAIGERWNAIGRVAFGYPLTDETPTAGRTGFYNQFRAVHLPGKPEGSIYYSQATGARAIYGAILQKWQETGWEQGPLGYPAKEEYDDAGFRRVDFEHGSMRWSAATGVTVMESVYGAIAVKYRELGGATGLLGASLGAEQDAPYGGRYNRFAKGWIYWHADTGAHAVYGRIAERWLQLGGPAFGYPVNDESSQGRLAYRYNDFKAVHLPGKPVASIYYSDRWGAKAVYGAIRDAWLAAGGSDGHYQVPKREEYNDAGFRRVDFEYGFIRWSKSLGAQAIAVDTTPGRCTRFLRKWSRPPHDDSFGLMDACVTLLGLDRYCDARDAFVAQFVLPNSDIHYLGCSPRSHPSTLDEQFVHIVTGTAQGLATAFVAAAPFVPTVIEGAGCITGVVISCGILAVDIATKLELDLPSIPKEALELAAAASACIDFDVVSCAKLGSAGLRASGYSIPGLDPAAIAAEVVDCANGDFVACAKLGRQAADAAGVPPGLGLADVASGIDCLNGDLESCKELGIEAAQANLPLGGINEGIALANACRSGDVGACQRLGRTLMGSAAPSLPGLPAPPSVPGVPALPYVIGGTNQLPQLPQSTQSARAPLPATESAAETVQERRAVERAAPLPPGAARVPATMPAQRARRVRVNP